MRFYQTLGYNEDVVETKSLVKIFGKGEAAFRALDDVSFQVRAGECFGLLGPNGAGKSTFIGMTYGSVTRTSGQVTVFGLDPQTQSRAIKKRLGVVTQENALDESLTVLENMTLYSAFMGVPRDERKRRIEELLEYMNIAHKRDALIQTLSGGMKRRLVFVRALLGQPELLILDEPTTGLDPAVRHLLWGKVKELRESGTTIILTTHYMHEAEVLCDRLAILNKGKIVAEGSPGKMIAQHSPGYMGIFRSSDGPKVRSILKADTAAGLHEDSSGFYLRVSKLETLTALVAEHDLTPAQIRPSNLEDVFLQLTGQELSVDA